MADEKAQGGGAPASPPRILQQSPADKNTPKDRPDLPDVREVPLPPLPRAGVSLANKVLLMMSVFIVLMLLLLTWSEWRSEVTAGSTLATISLRAGLDTVRGRVDSVAVRARADAMTVALDKVGSQQKEFRDFWFKTVQTVLLNALLPVLTALLGYIFAHRGDSAPAPDGRAQGQALTGG